MQLTQRAVACLSKRPVRLTVGAIWFGAALGGLLNAKTLKRELKDQVPPCEGTPSYDAQRAFDTYFPNQPVNGAIFVRSADGSPLLGFEPKSTCRVKPGPADIAGRTISLAISCENATALGGGCATRDDLASALEDVRTELAVALRGHMSAGNILKVGVELTLAGDSALSSVLVPTSCPTAAAGAAGTTHDWLEFMDSLNASLSEKLGHYHNSVGSMVSIPSRRIAVSHKLPGLSPPDVGWALNVSADIPSGELWDVSQRHLMADSLTASLVATLHTSLTGAKLEPIGEDADRIGQALTEIADGAPASLNAKVMSMALIGHAIFAGVDHTMDLSAMTVPLALLILAAVVRNLRLVLVTVVNLAACYCGATLIMCPIARNYTTASTAPALMVAVALAMSIDYSLFLLTRFQKEVPTRGVEAAVEEMLATSGRIVLVSGLTLFLCFLMMLSLPVAFVASMGVSAAVTVFTAVLAALTLTPVLLLSFPSFFISNRRWGLTMEGCCCRRRDRRRDDSQRAPAAFAQGDLLAADARPESQSGIRMAAMEAAVASAGFLEVSTQAADEKPGVWSRFGSCAQRFSWAIVAALLVVGVPLGALSLPRFRHAIGFGPMMPTDAEVTRTLGDLQAAFGTGAVFPTKLLVVPRDGATATENGRRQWLDEVCEALKNIADTADAGRSPGVPAFTASAFSGAMIMDGQCTQSGLGGSGEWSHVGGPFSATKVMISYEVDPFTTEGQQWIERLRVALRAPSAQSLAEWHVLGVAPIEMDVAGVTFQRLPYMIAQMMAAVFLVIAASTRSVVAPLRAVLCLTWMLVVTLGLAVFTFQDGMLGFLGWEQLGPRASGAMSWMSPCMATSVLVGLGLDYDIFYSERVIEEWQRGHSERVAAVRALSATANTISVAGLIMVVAFVALLLCTMPSLNEIAFMLIVGIIIDCVVATKIIIPCMMAILGKANFWPRKRPLEC